MTCNPWIMCSDIKFETAHVCRKYNQAMSVSTTQCHSLLPHIYIYIYIYRVFQEKHVFNFQWVWRYSCLNVTHKLSYKRYEGKTNDLLITFIGYVNDLNKLQQVKVRVKKSHHRLQCSFQFP
jgi:hypothetical protein